MSDQVSAVMPLNLIASAKVPDPSVRALGAKTGFEVLLDALRDAKPISPDSVTSASAAPAAAYTVKKGDTLSAICAAALRGRGETPTQSDILAATQKIAADNKLKSADRIKEGQQLSMAALTSPGKSSYAKAAGLLPQGGTAMNPVDWGMAMFADVVSTSDAKAEAQRLQAIVKEDSRISSLFGPRKNPFSGKAEFHSGIDIAAPAGSPVYPVRPGEVTFSGWQPGYGKIVIVRHEDSTQTVYAHNERNLVKKGQQIDWDTPISKVGSTGDSTGPHVHFELRKNGKPVKPDHFVALPSLKIAKAL